MKDHGPPDLPRAPRRRAFVALAAWAAFSVVLVLSGGVAAEGSAVPAAIQAELLARLANYDRGFPARAGDTAKVLILVKPGSTRSQVAAEEMRAALGHVNRLGGLPHAETVAKYENAEAAAQRVRAERFAVVYLAPGFDDDMGAIKAAFTGVDVLTLASLPTYVPDGAVLGFELESGKPKIVINLPQARAQKVDFPSDVLRLMRVYR